MSIPFLPTEHHRLGHKQTKSINLTMIHPTMLFIFTSFWMLLTAEANNCDSLPSVVIVNVDTQQCAYFQPGGNCLLPSGWKSIGSSAFGSDPATCPSDYEQLIDVGAYCRNPRTAGGCVYISCPLGNCDGLAYNEANKQCSFSFCETLPTGWSRTLNDTSDCFVPDCTADGVPSCPSFWDWVDNVGCANEPCPTYSTCGECISNNCMWANNTCQTACDDSKDSNCFSLDPNSAMTADESCAMFENILSDRMTCEEISDCQTCNSQALASSPTHYCQWISLCADTAPGLKCEYCLSDERRPCIFTSPCLEESCPTVSPTLHPTAALDPKAASILVGTSMGQVVALSWMSLVIYATTVWAMIH